MQLQVCEKPVVPRNKGTYNSLYKQGFSFIFYYILERDREIELFRIKMGAHSFKDLEYKIVKMRRIKLHLSVSHMFQIQFWLHVICLVEEKRVEKMRRNSKLG